MEGVPFDYAQDKDQKGDAYAQNSGPRRHSGYQRGRSPVSEGANRRARRPHSGGGRWHPGTATMGGPDQPGGSSPLGRLDPEPGAGPRSRGVGHRSDDQGGSQGRSGAPSRREAGRYCKSGWIDGYLLGYRGHAGLTLRRAQAHGLDHGLQGHPPLRGHQGYRHALLCGRHCGSQPYDQADPGQCSGGYCGHGPG